MHNYTLISNVSQMVANFTPVFDIFTNDFKNLESEVEEVIKLMRDEEYNSMKDRIRE